MRTFFLIVLLVALGLAGWFTWAALLPVTPPQTAFVLLRPGWTTRHIARELQHDGIIRNADAFLLLHYAQGLGSLKAGEYKFENPANALEVRRRLLRGDVYVRTVTVPEGYNIYDIAAVVEQAGLGTSADFVTAAKGDLFLIMDLDPNAISLEGYLFPDTYHFTRIDTAHEIVAAMVHRFRQEAQKIGLLRQGEHPSHRDHRVHRGEGNRRSRRAAAGGQRLLQPAGQEHAAGRRPERGLCGAAGRALSRNHLSVGPAIRLALQHLQVRRACPRARLPIREWPRWKRRCIPLRPISSISSATTTDITAFHATAEEHERNVAAIAGRWHRRNDAVKSASCEHMPFAGIRTILKNSPVRDALMRLSRFVLLGLVAALLASAPGCLFRTRDGADSAEHGTAADGHPGRTGRPRSTPKQAK